MDYVDRYNEHTMHTMRYKIVPYNFTYPLINSHKYKVSAHEEYCFFSLSFFLWCYLINIKYILMPETLQYRY